MSRPHTPRGHTRPYTPRSPRGPRGAPPPSVSGGCFMTLLLLPVLLPLRLFSFALRRLIR